MFSKLESSWRYNSPRKSCLTNPKQGSSQPKNCMEVCFRSYIPKKISPGFNLQPLNRNPHGSAMRNGCGSASMNNCYTPFCQPVTGWAKPWPGAGIALTAIRGTEADPKSEVNNHLFQICSMLHEGNKHRREFNTSGQERTFFWTMSSEPQSSISAWNGQTLWGTNTPQQGLICTKWQIKHL